MSRSLALMLAAATLVGCSSTPEQPLLQQFFAASRLRDNTTLAGFAATTFEPGTDGIVTTFSITNVTAEQRRSLTLKTLAQAHEDATAASESLVIDMSVNGGGTHVPVANYNGEIVWKEVSLSAPVKLPNGQTARKSYIVTMQRAILQADRELIGRWIITSIRDASGAASTPRS
jgi:hypothetical protein